MSIDVDYRFPADVDAEKQAKIIAVGQTVGITDARFANREAAWRSHCGEVVVVEKNAETGCSTATIRFLQRNV